MIGERRQARLGVLFRKEIADIVEHRMSDPRVGLLSITTVKVSADLSVATVYVSKLGTEEEVETSLNTLCRASSFIRGELAKRIRRIRQIPMLRFYEDEGLRQGERVDNLLRQWHEEEQAKDSE